jgi:hypothetical protein
LAPECAKPFRRLAACGEKPQLRPSPVRDEDLIPAVIKQVFKKALLGLRLTGLCFLIVMVTEGFSYLYHPFRSVPFR